MNRRPSPWRPARTWLITAASSAVLLAGVLAGCAQPEDQPADAGSPADAAPADLLAEHGLDGLDARQLIDRLDQLPLQERPAALNVSVRADEVVLSDSHEHQAQLPLPDESVYVSFAPYETQTHECTYHSPTGCKGELRNTDVAVSVTDDASGETILKDTFTTFDNGFVGLWLPRNISANVAVEAKGKRAAATISTQGADALTCITTLRLT